jgi:hypothetical protein
MEIGRILLAACELISNRRKGNYRMFKGYFPAFKQLQAYLTRILLHCSAIAYVWLQYELSSVCSAMNLLRDSKCVVRIVQKLSSPGCDQKKNKLSTSFLKTYMLSFE